MWRRAFVATTVALGGTVDDALRALENEAPETMRVPIGGADRAGPSSAEEPIADLVAGLTAQTRGLRALALATALRDVLVAADGIAFA